MSFKLKPVKEAQAEKTLVSFRLELGLFEDFQAACEQAGISVSEGLRQLIEQFLRPKR